MNTVTSVDQQFQSLSSSPFQSIATAQTDSETARNAALLHAYLSVQGQNVAANQQQQHQQQQWMFPSSTQLNVQLQQAQVLDQTKQLEQEQQHKQHTEQEKQVVQQADAQSLALYLAQSQQQIKVENGSETAMEHDTVTAPHSPSSSSSDISDKSPMGSPTIGGRSLSSESASPEPNATKNGSSKSSRQLECFNCKVTQTPLWRRTPDRMHSLCNACGLYYKQYGAHRPLNVRHKLPTILADVRLSSMPYARPSAASSRCSSPTPVSPTSSFTLSSAQDSSVSSSSSDSDSDSSLTSFPVLAKMYTEALVPSAAAAQRTSPPLMIAKLGIRCANCSQTQTPLWRKNDAGEPICNACGLYAKLHNRDRPVTMRKAKITRRRRDWGGNLAHQAQAQAHALALAHARAQAEAEILSQAQQANQANNDTKCGVAADSNEQSIVDEMARKARELVGCPSSSELSSESEEDPQPESPQLQQQQPVTVPTPTPVTSALAQSLSNNTILDDDKFTDLVGQMNAHQMNRFLSILETRCGVLRERLLATTEASAQQSDLDLFF
ncbi:hypothetical protein BGX21_004201 [Mortierella sp. AD011]|nr:hypothetical protein BGX20_008672 [Mortierella sp. AD010]KAF9403440.1 hypothetical protein BGX21_004201 [Mortierella sp. AD011]